MIKKAFLVIIMLGITSVDLGLLIDSILLEESTKCSFKSVLNYQKKGEGDKRARSNDIVRFTTDITNF